MPQQSINALDRRVYSSQNDFINNAVVSSTEQTIGITDIISEGPIQGRVHGTASVFLNGDPMDSTDSAVLMDEALEVKLEEGSKDVVVSTNGSIFNATLGDDDIRFLQVYDTSVVNLGYVLDASDIENGYFYQIQSVGNTPWQNIGAGAAFVVTDDEKVFKNVKYTIAVAGNTNWTALGAADGNPGTEFRINTNGHSGLGTGTVYPWYAGAGFTANTSSATGTGTVVSAAVVNLGGWESVLGSAVPIGPYVLRTAHKRLPDPDGGDDLKAAWDTSSNESGTIGIDDLSTTHSWEGSDGREVNRVKVLRTNVSQETTWLEHAGFSSMNDPSLLGGVTVSSLGTSTLKTHTFFKIEKIEGNTITLEDALPTGILDEDKDYKFSITSPKDMKGILNNSVDHSAKYKGATATFANGDKDQPPQTTLTGVGNSSVALSITNGETKKFEPGAPYYTTISASGAQASQIDEVKIIMQYPQGMYLQSISSGTLYTAGVAYHIEIAINTGTGTPEYITVPPPNVTHKFTAGVYEPAANAVDGDGIPLVDGDTPVWSLANRKTSKFSTEFRINIEDFQPFTGFTIRITRLTKDRSDDYTSITPWARKGNQRGGGVDQNLQTTKGSQAEFNAGGQDGKHLNGVYASTVTQALGIIKEKLNFPYTAYANIQFSSKSFQSAPTRTYECHGMRVKVPSNYITREEMSDGTLTAKYTRDSEDKNVLLMTKPQLWDGNFREKLIYTDNPAWVFYDICTNKRYGLGDYLKETDIDKFSLYKVAKYCDELVPDGKGGFEPRFRSNIYLTKSTDAYKILKDFATVFRGILYWSNSQFNTVIDEPKEPIYTFSRSNVINGMFEYQSSGSKTRINQVVVAWNNPNNEYKIEPIIIEDRENIIKTGSVRSDKAVAFGCTSEGQAIRYGRWKLWTAINQTEIVSFKTGINGAFLTPGDVINIQDESDFRIPFSGRVNSCTSSSITIDREIKSHFAGGYEYTISVIIPKRTVVLNQDVATLDNSSGSTTTFERGDEITHAAVWTGHSSSTTTELLNASEETTQKNIESAVDTSGNFVNLQYVEETILEERILNTGNATTSDNKDTIPFYGAQFSTTPSNGDVWAIKQVSTSDDTVHAASYKEYKILNIAESGKTEYAIMAVEFYNTKFDLVDRDFSTAAPDPLYPREDSSLDVPKPRNLRALRTPSDITPGEELTLEWDAPLSTIETGMFGVNFSAFGIIAFPVWQFLAEFEIEHTFGPESGLVSGSRVGPQELSQKFTKVPNGEHLVSICTISNSGRRSQKALFNITIDDIFEGSHERLGGISKGGYSTEDVFMTESGDDKGTVSFAKKSYIAAPFTAIQRAKNNTSADADSYSILCTALANNAYPTSSPAYVMMDFSELDAAAPNANALKLVSRKLDSTTYGSTVDYWYDVTKYVASASSIWTNSGLGTVSVTPGTSKIIGSGFSTLKIPEVVTIYGSDGWFAGKVALISSDTVMYLDRSWTANSGTALVINKQELDIDYEKDFLITPVSYSSANSGTYTLGGAEGAMSFLEITKDLKVGARSAVVTSNVPFLQYAADNSQETDYTNIQLKIGAVGFEEPEFNITGAGFSQVNTSADGADDWAEGTNGTLTKTVHSNSDDITYSATPIDFTIKVREGLDPDNTDKQITDTHSIGKIREGAQGNSTALVYMYKNATSDPGASDIGSSFPTVTVTLSGSGAGTITGAVGGISSGQIASTGWYISPQTITGTNKQWVVAATGNSTATTDTIGYAEWSDPVQFSGADGTDGLNSATVEIWKLTNASSESTKPSGDTTYTFANGTLALTSGSLNGWVQKPTTVQGTPTSSNKYLWKRTAAAINTTATDVIGTGEWSDPIIAAQYGAEGDPGKLSTTTLIYKTAPTATNSNPGKPFTSGTRTFTFATRAIDGAATGWSFTPPTFDATVNSYYWASTFTADETTAGTGTATITEANFSEPALIQNFSGVVAFSDLSSSDPSNTIINGDNITTGAIQSDNFAGGVTNGSAFSTAGMMINLKNTGTDKGSITAQKFRIDEAGNAEFGGTVKGAGFSGENTLGNSSGDKITIGDYMTIDGNGEKITITDGTNPRVVLGKLTT